jgi:hypothetical protein
MMPLKKLLVLSVAAAAACSKSAPETQPEPQVQSVRVNNTVEAPLDCNEATRRAVANPNIDVEKVAAPLKMTPAPIDTRKMPKGVADKNGWYHVKFHVVVDAAGKPDMKTFAVDTTSHPWLATSVKSAVAQWKFSPAEVAGCKVPRNYSLGISPRGKSPAAAATKPAAKNIPKAAPAKKPPTR